MPTDAATTLTSSNFLPRLISAMDSRHSIEGLDASVWIRWAIVLVLWIAIALWHYRQQAGFHSFLRSHKQKSAVGVRLYQLAQNRSFEVLMLCAFIFFGMIYHDTRIRALEQGSFGQRTQIADSNQVIDTYEELLMVQAEELENMQRLAGMDENQQNALDSLKRRYENLYINYHVLQRCNTNSKTDYHLITSALMRQLGQLNAPARQQQNIANAAHGSYSELYVGLECDTPEVTNMQNDMRRYLDSVLAATPQH